MRRYLLFICLLLMGSCYIGCEECEPECSINLTEFESYLIGDTIHIMGSARENNMEVKYLKLFIGQTEIVKRDGNHLEHMLITTDLTPGMYTASIYGFADRAVSCNASAYIYLLNEFASVVTNEITNITASSATSGGIIISDNEDEILERGICWSRNSKPTIWDERTIDGSGTGEFSSQITGLYENSRYYVRAYAKNEIGPMYGQEIEFQAINPVK